MVVVILRTFETGCVKCSNYLAVLINIHTFKNIHNTLLLSSKGTIANIVFLILQICLLFYIVCIKIGESLTNFATSDEISRLMRK